MRRLNTCKPRVSKGRSCTPLVQNIVPPCIWYLSVATLAQLEVNNMYTSTVHNVTRNPKHRPKQKEPQRSVYFSPAWESAYICTRKSAHGISYK